MEKANVHVQWSAADSTEQMQRRKEEAMKERFVEVYTQGVANVRKVFVDTETGVNYLLASSNMTGGCSMTVLVDAEGEPVVTHLDESDRVMMGQLFGR